MSKPYMVSYDLNTPGQKYSEITDIIKNFGGPAIRLQKSFWLVRNDLTPDEMVKKFQPVLDKNDELFICEVSKNYQGLTTDSAWKFISESILY